MFRFWPLHLSPPLLIRPHVVLNVCPALGALIDARDREVTQRRPLFS